jgi:hypothetical protein
MFLSDILLLCLSFPKACFTHIQRATFLLCFSTRRPGKVQSMLHNSCSWLLIRHTPLEDPSEMKIFQYLLSHFIISLSLSHTHTPPHTTHTHTKHTTHTHTHSQHTHTTHTHTHTLTPHTHTHTTYAHTETDTCRSLWPRGLRQSCPTCGPPAPEYFQ